MLFFCFCYFVVVSLFVAVLFEYTSIFSHLMRRESATCNVSTWLAGLPLKLLNTPLTQVSILQSATEKSVLMFHTVRFAPKIKVNVLFI